MRKVFLSSRMKGMEKMRAAVDAACESINIQIIKAEDFSAHAGSPRGVCLQQLSLSDGVVLLIGSEYGAVLESGMSATEEEFQEARRLRKDVFVFRTSKRLDRRQQEFLDRIGSWQGGLSYRLCSTAMDLQREIVKTLLSWVSGHSADEADQTVKQNLRRVSLAQNWGLIGNVSPYISVSWAPKQTLTLDEEFVFDHMPGVVADRLVAGSTRVLSVRPDVRPEEEGLVIRSRESERPVLRAWLGTDGSVAVGAEIESTADQLMTSVHYLRPRDLEAALSRLVAFVGLILGEIDSDVRCTSGHMQVGLSNLGLRRIDEPKPAQTVFQIPMSGVINPNEPIIVPSDSVVVVRSQLIADSPEVMKFANAMRRKAESR